MRATKVSIGTQHTGTFAGGQMQAQARLATQKVNSLSETVTALVNHAYSTLATDVTATTSYVTLLTANITTVLESGYLLITLTASGARLTNPATTFFQVLVDGTVIKGTQSTDPAGYGFSEALVLRVAVTRGDHVVLVQWSTDNATTSRINAATIVTEHASVLVQEAP
jgi:hypothetical protein